MLKILKIDWKFKLTLFQVQIQILKIDLTLKLTFFQVQIQILWILFKILKIDRKLDIV